MLDPVFTKPYSSLTPAEQRRYWELKRAMQRDRAAGLFLKY